LYRELRKLSGYDLIAGKLNYEAIQQLKQADRETTLKLFYGSSYEVLQQLKTEEPEEVARYLVENAKAAAADGSAGSAVLIIIAGLG
jgi:hypothetical protein